MAGGENCPWCGAPLQSSAVCPSCGMAIRSHTSMGAPTSASGAQTGAMPPNAGLPAQQPPEPLPPSPPLMGRIALLALNVVLLLVAVALIAANILSPARQGSQGASPLATQTATIEAGATDVPIMTVSVPASHPTNTPTGQGALPPTATPRPTATATAGSRPTATATPTPDPSPTAQPGG